jgi:hypothetical protein
MEDQVILSAAVAQTPTTHELVESMKTAALAAIAELVSHHVKGADLLQKGFEQMTHIATEVADWYEMLKNILNALKPFFGVVEVWLKATYAHLVEIFEWAKAMWHKLFGSK